MDKEPSPFLDEVLKHPEDDIPRLVYADWLEGQGDPRGEFIRVQCQLAKTDRLTPRYFELSDQNDALLRKHGQRWAGELEQDIRKAEFHRGFIDTITIRARAFATQGDELVRFIPVHWLRFNYVGGAGQQLAATSALKQVRALDLSTLSIPHEDLETLLSSPHLSNLHELNLSNPAIPLQPDMGSVLQASRFAESLRSLDLLARDYTTGFVNAFVRGNGFPHLEHLGLGAEHREPEFANLGHLHVPRLISLELLGRLTENEAAGLCRLPVSQLQRIDLSETSILSEAIQLLAEHQAFDAVEELDLSDSNLPVSGQRWLFQGEQLTRCRRLLMPGRINVQDREKTPEFIEKLAGHTALSALEQLHLVHVRDRELQVLGASGCLQGLRLLRIKNVQMAKSGAQAIADSSLPTSLRQLSFAAASLDAEAAEALCQTEFPHLLSLDLESWSGVAASLDEETVIHLIESAAFSEIRSLKLTELDLTSRTLEALAKRSDLSQLRRVFFDGNQADNESVRAVLNSDRLPNLAFLSVTNATGMRNRPKLAKEFGYRIRV